jgi:toxin secretion/phage lysis holin
MIQVNTVNPDITSAAKGYVILALLALNISVEQIGFLLVLVFVDSFFGVIREIKLKAPLSWERFIWGITSKFAILLIPFLIAWFGLAFKVNLVYIVQAFIYIIAANDVISIITNIASIRSGQRFKNVDFIEKGIHVLTNFFVNLVNAKLGKKNETD